MPEDAVWSLRKQDLRACFLTLQSYAQKPYPLLLPPSSSSSTPRVQNSELQYRVTQIEIPALLRLPLEIRQLIYTYLLPPPGTALIRGPHPRQLQSCIHLTQAIFPALLILNQQTRREALPLLYGCALQCVHINIDYKIWSHQTSRGDLVLSSQLTSAIKHIHISICLGSEKRASKPSCTEADARLMQVKKGLKKVAKWLAGADIASMRISWQEPAQTFTWEQKRDVMDGLRMLRAERVEAGKINWGQEWNRGRKYRFEIEYLRELERVR